MAHRTEDAKPWYREPWPWLLMAGPTAVMVAGLLTAYIAVTTNDGLVADDYYRRGLAINATLVRQEHARELGLSAVVSLSPGRDTVRVALTGNVERRASMRLRFAHPTRAGQDQSAVLSPIAGGDYGATLKPLAPGAWQVLLDDDASGWRLVGVLPRGSNRLELRPQGN
jgi:hypothetical protein